VPDTAFKHAPAIDGAYPGGLSLRLGSNAFAGREDPALVHGARWETSRLTLIRPPESSARTKPLTSMLDARVGEDELGRRPLT
jgi:hypothetical protein